MNIHIPHLFKGPGARRRTPESQAAMERENRQLRGDAARLDPCACRAARPHVQFLVRRPDGASPSVEPLDCPACEIDRLNSRLSVLTAPSAPPSALLLPAAVDSPDFQPLPAAPLVSADNHLLIMPDAPEATETVPIVDVTAETQATDVQALRDAIGLGDTATLPAVRDEPQGAVRRVLPITADQLRPARADVPPKLPPAHLVKQQRVTFEPWLRPREDAPDPLAADDLKTKAPAGDTTLRGIPVQFAKTG